MRVIADDTTPIVDPKTVLPWSRRRIADAGRRGVAGFVKIAGSWMLDLPTFRGALGSPVPPVVDESIEADIRRRFKAAS